MLSYGKAVDQAGSVKIHNCLVWLSTIQPCYVHASSAYDFFYPDIRPENSCVVYRDVTKTSLV